jgi:transposase
MPIKVVARVMGCSKNTVKRALASEGPPVYQRPPRGSIVDVVEPGVRELLQAWPTMPTTVIAERIGWDRSIRVLRDRVAELRPVYLPPDPASRTAYAAGEVAQCDLWFPDIQLPVGFGQSRGPTRLPVLVMVTGYARWLSARLLPSRAVEDLLGGWWALLLALGAVPRVLVWDGEAAIGRWRRGRSELTAATQAFRGTLATRVVICRPADPEAKGLVERANGYLETSFLPGRTFTGPADFNTQLAAWTATVNTRQRRVLAAPRPSESRPTGPRCSSCHHSRRPPGGGPRCGCRGTTTCAWTATTTRCIRPPWAAASRSPPTSSASRSTVMAAGRRARPLLGSASNHRRSHPPGRGSGAPPGAADRPDTHPDPGRAAVVDRL